ncbi:hypothetical protein Aperf_G00000117815 [Anoplocephala perfoliata]
MFCIVPITDLVLIKPRKFGLDLQDVIAHKINSLFSNKILYKVGLCISVWDITAIGDIYISHDDESFQVNVTFRLLCFRPSIDEVIIGTVKNCTKEGIQISLNFFDDIFVPVDKLKHPSKLFRVDQEVWQDANPNESKDDQASLATPLGWIDCI